MSDNGLMFRIPQGVRDLVLLITRVALGIIFMAHGWQKFNDWGIEGTQASFEQMGAPVPDISAVFAASVELVGGALLILGLLTPIVGVLMAIVTVGALVIVHFEQGLLDGYELVLALAAGALTFAVVGPGRFSIDTLFFKRTRH